MLRSICLVSGAALAAIAVLVLPPRAVSAEDECPTWFPDFRCERSGRFEGFEKPIVQPFLFEDPFIVTGLYPYYAWHDFPGRSAFRGGEAHVAAVQARIAITDRLAFVATKDGRVWTDPELSLLDDHEGWFNIAGGFKYALLQDREENYIVTPGLRIEVPTGSSDVLSGGSEAIMIPSVSAAWGVEKLHLIGDLGGQIPLDGRRYSSSIFYHLYADYQVVEHFQPFLQLSGIHYVESGAGDRPVELNIDDAFPGKHQINIPLDTVQQVLNTGSFEGADVLNLGSKGVDNNDYVTLAIGTHFPINRHLTLSIAYERPISNRKDITKQRVTTAVRFEF